MAGAGLAADVIDAVNKPYGRLFTATGNGSFNAATPYTSAMNFGDDVIRFDLSGGVLTVQDSFTPYNQASLNSSDQDLASGGVTLLPDQAVGGHTHLLTQIGKQGVLYLVDRDAMSGYNTTTDHVVQEIAGESGGLWSIPAFWNNSLYTWGSNNFLRAFTLSNGLLSNTPTSTGPQSSGFPGATPSVSSNGSSNGIVWAIQTDGYNSPTPAILRAYDAGNVSNELYDSTQNSARDTAGMATKFAVPTVANGKVYVGTAGELDIYGLLSAAQTAAVPVISPSGQSFNGSLSVSITDSTSGSSIYYTTDGSTPTTASTKYTGAISVTTTETISAMASAAGYSNSAVGTATYTIQLPAATPTFSPVAGTYATSQSVTISDSTAGATIYYTTNGTTPTTASTKYVGAISVASSETLNAIATATGFSTSAVGSAAYAIQTSAATPAFSPAGGTYTSAQSVVLSDTTAGATIYYTTNGTAPTTSSTKYTSPISVSATTTINAMAVATGYNNSGVAAATYTINSSNAIGFANGFSSSTGLQFNGGSALNGTRLRITDGGTNEARSAYWTTPVNIQNFTTDFTFQQVPGTTPTGDGFAFVLQNTGLTALGPMGGGLGYGPDTPGGTAGIGKSIAIKFDLYSNAGEGSDSTGLYVNGASPTTPAVDMTASGLNLHSGNIMHAHVTYDGTNLGLTITDTVTAASFTYSWPINLSSAIGSTTAYAGFSGGTGGSTAIQDVITWTYAASAAKTPVTYWTPNLTAVSSGPTFRTFAWAGFPEGSGTTLDATGVGNYVTFTINVAQAGVYDISYGTKLYSTRGTSQLSINGTNFGPVVDQYNSNISFASFDLGTFNFAAAGNYFFRFTVTGKDAASSGYTMAFDDIVLTPQ